MQSYRVSDGEAEGHLIAAFRGCVLAMAPASRFLAYHAIAYSMDWGTRAQIWKKAQLPIDNFGRCKFE